MIDTTPSSSNVEDGLKPTYLLEIPEEFILPLEKLEKLKESQELKQLLEVCKLFHLFLMLRSEAQTFSH